MKTIVRFYTMLGIVTLLALSTAQAREKWDANHPSHDECKRDHARVECPVTCIDRVPFRIKKSGCYLVTKDLSHYDKCPAISVEADHVQIEFCKEAELWVDGCSTGIKVKGNDVSIVNGTFKGKSNNARAIELCSGIKGWTIDHCNFNDFEEAISSTNFTNGI